MLPVEMDQARAPRGSWVRRSTLLNVGPSQVPIAPIWRMRHEAGVRAFACMCDSKCVCFDMISLRGSAPTSFQHPRGFASAALLRTVSQVAPAPPPPLASPWQADVENARQWRLERIRQFRSTAQVTRFQRGMSLRTTCDFLGLETTHAAFAL